MRSFKELTEAKETVVFGFGRFNPPTTGHEKLIEKVASVAGSNPFFIYPSHTTGPKDPLPHAKKVAWMRKMFPKYKKNIIADKNAKTAIQIAEKLYKDGYKNLIMVAGSDRLKEFDTLLQRYNDAPDKKGNQLFKFDSVKVINAGERDPDAEGVSGMSASKMRAAAADGKFDSFKTGIPDTLNDADKKKLYFEVRKNMGIREERQMDDDYDLLRDAYLTGKLWNVGDIVEANDVRGEVVRKGTNYLSYVAEDGKVHKAWLHEILVEEITKKDLDQVEKFADRLFAKVGIDVEFTRHFMDRVNDARNKKPITTSELTRLFKQSYAKFGKKIAQLGPDAEAVINDMKTDVNMPFVLNLKGQELELVAKTVMRKKDFKTSGPKMSFEDIVGVKPMSGPTGQIFALKSEEAVKGKDVGYPDESVKIGKKHYIIYKGGREWYGYEVDKEGNQLGDSVFDPKKSELIKILAQEGLDERNYAKEYANYQGTPEQIARRSSRNKARRAMGDKAVKGMDVGHKDNDPLNNDPKNLRNEDPSKNRREPRLREATAADIKKGDTIILNKSKRPYTVAGITDPKKTLPAESDKMVVNKITKTSKGRKAHLTYHDTKKRGGFAIYLDKMPDFMSVKIAEEVELDEMAWYKVALAKISQLNHPKDYEKMVKQYVTDIKKPELKNKTASYIAARIAQEYMGQDGRKLVQYINKLVDDGKLPKELKAEYQEEETMQTFSDFVKQINEVKQDKDVDDKDGTQPAKYYAGDMAKSTKSKRDAHFKAKKAGPAPGDADAKTKPSTHTKKFKQMYGEALPKDADQGDYIDDFEKSDAPQFKGKSKEKRKDMAIAAYLSKNESLLDNVNKMLSMINESGHTDVASMKNKVQIAMSALQKMQGELGKLGDEDDLPTWWTNKVATAVSRLDDMSDYLDTQVESVELDEKIEGLVKKADKSGMPYSILKKVYDRGMAAWKTGHRPGTTPQQWAMARVNSFTTKSSGTWGKADKDLAKQVEQIEESCTELNEWGEVTEVDAKSGKELNNPTKGDVKKYKVYVKNAKGNVIKVEFGDPNMSIQRDDPKARANFRARHNCDQKKDKTTAGYWLSLIHI